MNASDIYWTVHHCDNWRIKNQLEVTCYFIVLLIGSTCFGHYYAHHQELATMMLITTLVLSWNALHTREHHDHHALKITSININRNTLPTTTRWQRSSHRTHATKNHKFTSTLSFTERYDQCGNQHHSRELLIMGIVMPETCWAYKKYNKITSGIWLVFYSSVCNFFYLMCYRDVR